MPFSICCPHCGRSCRIPRKYAGHTISCPKCSKLFRVPEEEIPFTPPPVRTVESSPTLGKVLANEPNEELDFPQESQGPNADCSDYDDAMLRPRNTGQAMLVGTLIALLFLIFVGVIAILRIQTARHNRQELRPEVRLKGGRNEKFGNQPFAEKEDRDREDEPASKQEEPVISVEPLRKSVSGLLPRPLPVFDSDEHDEPLLETPDNTVHSPSKKSSEVSQPSIEDLSNAITLNPTDPMAYYCRGNAHLGRDSYDEAIKDFNQAIKLSPLLSDAYAKRNLAYKKRLKAGPIPGYRSETLEGFRVLISNAEFTHNDESTFQRKPLDVLKLELATIVHLLPKRAVLGLRTVLIWVEWHDDQDSDAVAGVIAKYYGMAGNRLIWGLSQNKHPLKANSVEIINMQMLTALHQPDVKHERCIILHELAHAVHFQLFGAGNVHIQLAYQQAMDRKLYETSKDEGGESTKPYAGVNEYEYFAELSCAYFNRLGYFPFTRGQLRKYDPTGYRMMELVWGKTSPKS
jgi:tetratricopeptide (TPR) repeat protein